VPERCLEGVPHLAMSSPCPPRNAETTDEKAKHKYQAGCDQETHDHLGVMRQPDNEGQVLAEIGRGENPDEYPERCSGCIEQCKTPPGHSQHSRHDAVELAQDAEESSEQHGRRYP